MGWIAWMALLVGWLLAGMAVAWMFGRLVQRDESEQTAGQLKPPVLGYLRRVKRHKPASRAAIQGKTRRVAGGRR